MKILGVNDIYNKYTSIDDFELEDERYWGQIRKIADNIVEEKDEKPILLLSGPSGSGKTTTAKRIERFLDEKGIETHTISLDCYFSSLTPELVKTVDLESPERLDKDLLAEHIYKLLNCEEIELPEFDFLTTTQIKSGVKLSRKPNEIIIFEGIHALNPSAVNVDHGTAKMYISVRSRLSYGEGKILHPRFIRLLRRMSRDMRYRGRTPVQTLSFFKDVEKGVDNFVSPYKIYADYSIDTFIGYEPLIYRDEMLLKLTEERDLTGGYEREVVDMLIEFLNSFEGRNPNLVSKDSLIREFIGEKI
ncbi:MAG: nucleoside kinase [Clostridiales bacterium]|nr:nucleoside kinase [Clostridiales bacterium]